MYFFMIGSITIPKVFFLFLFLFSAFHCGSVVEKHRVVIDPGHGGANIFINKRPVKSDRWDPVTGSYLSYYLSGMEADGYKEHLVMLSLAKRVKYYLDLTKSPWGWSKFEELLQKFSTQTQFKTIVFTAKLTRRDSWNQRYEKAETLNINNSYRMYDYPDERGRMRYGRLSFINHYRPSLVLSLHMTPAGYGNEGGMAAVISPGFQSYDLVRRIHLNQESRRAWNKSPWNGVILSTEPGWNQFELMRADAWVYFHGYRSNRRGTEVNFNAVRGIRQNLVSWAYKENEGWEKDYKPQAVGPYALHYPDFRPAGSKFWERERSLEELWRREAGPLALGGDNHYVSDELMRFVQHGVRLLRPHMRAENKIGKIHYPFASAYTLPIYVNAIVAFLEIGYLNRKRDRNLIIGEQEAVAQSLAAGIYSLYSGLSLKAVPENQYSPRGTEVDFAKYGNYFESAVR